MNNSLMMQEEFNPVGSWGGILQKFPFRLKLKKLFLMFQKNNSGNFNGQTLDSPDQGAVPEYL